MNEQSRTTADMSAAQRLLLQLKAAGIDYLFVNGDSDFPPVVEAYARSRADGTDFPRAVVVPHENAAVAMAHGIFLATQRIQAVMVHVNVGSGGGSIVNISSICGIVGSHANAAYHASKGAVRI